MNRPKRECRKDTPNDTAPAMDMDETAVAQQEWDTAKESAKQLGYTLTSMRQLRTKTSDHTGIFYSFGPNASRSKDGDSDDSGVMLVICWDSMTALVDQYWQSLHHTSTGSRHPAIPAGADTTTLPPRVALVLQQLRDDRDIRYVLLTGENRATGSVVFAPILQKIVKAAAMNSSIQVFVSQLKYFPWQHVTEYLEARPLITKRGLSRIDGGGANDAEAVARAIVAILTLTTLAVPAKQALLEALPSHPNLHTLQLWFTEGPPHGSILSNVLKTCTNLQHILPAGLDIDADLWKCIVSGLQDNPTIAVLTLKNTVHTNEATTLFLDHFRSTDTRQHIRSFRLEAPIFRSSNSRGDAGQDLADMIRGSLLNEFELQVFAERGNEQDMVHLLRGLSGSTGSSTHGSTAHLKSLRLSIPRHMQRHVARYLETTLHLRHLTLTLTGPPRSVPVPSTFLTSVRRNNSLHGIEIEGYDEETQAQALGFLSAVMERNRNLPPLITTALLQSDAAPVVAAPAQAVAVAATAPAQAATVVAAAPVAPATAQVASAATAPAAPATALAASAATAPAVVVNGVESSIVASAATTTPAPPNLFPTLRNEARHMVPSTLLMGLKTLEAAESQSPGTTSRDAKRRRRHD